jgi:hypothetical protein
MTVNDLTFNDLDREVSFYVPLCSVATSRVCQGTLKAWCPDGHLIIETVAAPKPIRHLILASDAWIASDVQEPK